MSTIVVMNLVSVFKNITHEMYFWGFSHFRLHDFSSSKKNCCYSLRKLLWKTDKIPYLHTENMGNFSLHYFNLGISTTKMKKSYNVHRQPHHFDRS